MWINCRWLIDVGWIQLNSTDSEAFLRYLVSTDSSFFLLRLLRLLSYSLRVKVCDLVTAPWGHNDKDVEGVSFITVARLKRGKRENHTPTTFKWIPFNFIETGLLHPFPQRSHWKSTADRQNSIDRIIEIPSIFDHIFKPYLVCFHPTGIVRCQHIVFFFFRGKKKRNVWIVWYWKFCRLRCHLSAM